MKYWQGNSFVMTLLVMLLSLTMINGCDSGKDVVDEVTGNRAVQQYKKSKKATEKIADQQAERYGSIPDDDKEDDEQ